ncbi:MAG: hypothetical protein RI935_735 [Candidatus Parcubacteria bacterium]|jgi:glycosyltransferase involved in cell wall biosynthesis
MKKLSIVIPCYNEGGAVHQLLARYEQVLAGREDVEVIVVNDGSKDDTQVILEEESSRLSFLKVLHIYPNGGYGNAIVTGLKTATGEFVGWTHGDMQTPPEDVIRALDIIESSADSQHLYVKGKRQGRALPDVFFTVGMSLFESLLFRMKLNDINAQPNIFHHSFFKKWEMPPKDFSLDLYAFVLARRYAMKVKRFPVSFNARTTGVSSWNTDWKSKVKFIKRTLNFSFKLAKQ